VPLVLAVLHRVFQFLGPLFGPKSGEDLPENTMADAERWAAGLSNPAYAIDDDTAIKVIDGTVEVTSEGHWRLFPHSVEASESR